jgi:hypothetical protein
MERDKDSRRDAEDAEQTHVFSLCVLCVSA